MGHLSSPPNARLLPIERFVLTCIKKELPPFEGHDPSFWDTVDSLIEQGMIELSEMIDEDTPVTARITRKGLAALAALW